ncbi:extracellular solute-binding protein [Paenibacillus yanchengensis]|uniref:Extracellular solute-binding protein n=1 Tax=Paenibacillus yanchengensis TaxID=2035833 RepID=A0ABW4YG69_9BACL
MRKKQRLVLMTSIILVFSLLLAACSGSTKGNNETPAVTNKNGNEQQTAEGSKEVPPFGEEPLEFSFYSNYDFSSPFGFGNDPSTKWLQEEKKFNLIEIGSNGNAKQKFGTMVAAKEFPDVIMLDRGSAEYTTMVENNLLVPLNEYYEKYPTLRGLIDDSTFNLLTHKDGNIYVMPNWFDSEKNPFKYSNTGWTVNKTIYRELGEPKLTNLDELYNYLKQVKEKYPNVIPLETGITINGVNMLFKLIYTSYGENRTIWNIGDIPQRPNYETSELESIFNDPAFKETIVYMNKLYREGLITQDMFTQKAEQVTEKLNTGRVAVTAFSNITGFGNTANKVLQANDPEAGYDYIPFLAAPGVDPETVYPHTFGTLGWNINVITTAAKDPERIFQFYDWFASEEGQRLNAFGPPGLLYDELDENGAPIDNEYAKNITAEEKVKLQIGLYNPMGSWLFYKIGHFKNAQNPETADWGNEASEFFGARANINADQFNDVRIDPKSDLGIAQEHIKLYWFEQSAKMIFADSEAQIDKIYEELEREVVKLGYEDLLKERTEMWRSNLEKMK